ncbi:MAG: TonB-dependent receptor plug domain-containing protein, partial [Phenylobacterium sp.]
MSATTASAQTAANEPAALEEVIVTAQKREQRLLDVPVAVTVVGAGQMERAAIKNIGELQFAVPTLNFNAGPLTSYSVRGVGTATFTRTAENGVSVVVDGVVQGQLVPPSGGIFDVARVEVLSGPQGMLFGKNASAGVVHIVTTAPVLGETEFSGKVDLGEAGLQSYRGIANLPLGDTSALRISAFSDSQQGRLWNLHKGRGRVGGYNNAGVRARLLWDPTENVSVNLIADYEKNHGGNSVWTSRKAGPVTPVLNACGVTPGPENTDLCLDGP